MFSRFWEKFSKNQCLWGIVKILLCYLKYRKQEDIIFKNVFSPNCFLIQKWTKSFLIEFSTIIGWNINSCSLLVYQLSAQMPYIG